MVDRPQSAGIAEPAGAIGQAARIDPGALMRIRSLELRARVVVEGFLHGLHRSPFHGFSVEFSEYRPYSPGDDLRTLDWKLYARCDRHYVRRYEDETNVRCHLLVDVSRSMRFGSLAYPKEEYGRTLAATLAHFLWSQRDAVGLVAFAEEIVETLPPRYRPGHLRRLMLSLERAADGGGTDLGACLARVASALKRRGLVVIISDFLQPLGSLEIELAALRSQGHEVILMRVVDPAEETLDLEAPALFEDLESGRELYVDPAAVRREYRRRFREHQQALGSACANLGIDCIRLRTDRPLEDVLFEFLAARSRRARGAVERRHSPRRASGAETGAPRRPAR